MKSTLLTGLFLFSFSILQAQVNIGTDYRTSLGVKVYPGAVTVKHFINPTHAVEALGYIATDEFRLTGLYELHYPLGNVEGLKWYLGGGAHVGIGNDNWRKPGSTAIETGLSLGLDGVLGIDYKIKGAPLNLSFDWQPSFNILTITGFQGGWGGLGVRYTF